MNKNKLLVSILLITSTGISSCASELKEAQRPNILFIMSDDHAYRTYRFISGMMLPFEQTDEDIPVGGKH